MIIISIHKFINNYEAFSFNIFNLDLDISLILKKKVHTVK